MKGGHLPPQQAQQPHLHIHHQQQQFAAELANRRNLLNQQFIENELAKIQQEKLRIQRQQESLAQKVYNTVILKPSFSQNLIQNLNLTPTLKHVHLLLAMFSQFHLEERWSMDVQTRCDISRTIEDRG